jgi:hypothetical protein
MPARISEKGGVTALEDVVKVTLLQENEAAASTDIKESLFHLDQQIEDLTSKESRVNNLSNILSFHHSFRIMEV